MADQYTRGDSVRDYLTGASSAVGTQTDPNASLGNYRSSTEAVSYTVSVTSPISGITVEAASGSNTEGAGQIEAVDANTLRWRSNGNTYGPDQVIANGETKILEQDSLPGAFVRVTRTSATALSGTATVTLTKATQNVYGFDNVSSAEAAAGDTEYRCVITKNCSILDVDNYKVFSGTLGTQGTSDTTQLGAVGAGTIETTGSYADWPTSGWVCIRSAVDTVREVAYYSSRTDTVLTVETGGRARLGTSAAAGAAGDTVDAVPGIAIGANNAGVQASGAQIQQVADEDTAPAGVTFVVGLTAASGVNVGTIGPNEEIGIWLMREIPASATSIAQNEVRLKATYDAI